MKIATKKNGFLVKVEPLEKEGGFEKVGSLFKPVDSKTRTVDYRIAEIILVSEVLTEEYQGLYEKGDKIMINPILKGNKIGDNLYVPVDVIYGKI